MKELTVNFSFTENNRENKRCWRCKLRESYQRNLIRWSIYLQLEDDEKFKEFVALHQNLSIKPSWQDDGVIINKEKDIEFDSNEDDDDDNDARNEDNFKEINCDSTRNNSTECTDEKTEKEEKQVEMTDEEREKDKLNRVSQVSKFLI